MHDAWIAHSLRRYYPASPPETTQTLELDAARGERISFQVACRTGARDAQIEASVRAPDPLRARIRRVGYVPAQHLSTQTPLEELEGSAHIPGFVPDPLFPEAAIHAGPYETHAFWVDVEAPREAAPGSYAVKVTLEGRDGETHELVANLRVHAAILAPRRDFPVTHWFYVDALCDWYKVDLVDEAFWGVLEPYLANLTAHGQDTILVPLFTPPTDGVKRPTQLLRVQRAGERYDFDWSLVRRWIDVARSHGIRYFEWSHLATQWGAQHAIRIYEGHGAGERLLWEPDMGATSAVYRAFLSQLLPELEQFLRDEGILEQSFFHLSDEPHGSAHLASYRAAREMLRELAPWMRVMDALTEIDFAREGLTDIPIPLLTTAPDFVRAGFPAWAYFCCVPRGRYLNRLVDTPLVKIRMSGWLFYRNCARGFLHWGYNYWYRSQTRELIDPFAVLDAMRWPSWAAGDPFVVYPGPDGPIDSLRWEVFAESLQDYALLQAAGLDPDDPALAEIVDYAEFPRDPDWLLQRRRMLLERLDDAARRGGGRIP